MATILVIDDDLLFHRIIGFMLKRNRHTVLTTESVTEAWNVLGTQSVDLAFIDLDMPHTNGIEFLEQLRADARYAQLPVVIITASADWKDRVEALDRGATAFLQKPTSSWELSDTVARLLPSMMLISGA